MSLHAPYPPRTTAPPRRARHHHRRVRRRHGRRRRPGRLLYKLLTGGFGDQLLTTLFDHVLGLLGIG